MLRHAIAHFRRQDWMAVVIELIVVILGVFIGVQASNWNEQRETDQKAAVFTERLKADLREEDWGYQLLIAYNREVLVSANRAVNALDNTAPLSDEALLVSAYRATQYKQRVRRRSTYDELISTGAIGLIGDNGLRDTAMRVYNFPSIDNFVREGRESRYREAFRMALPNTVQRALGKRCGDRYIKTGDYSAIHGILDYPCTTGLAAQELAKSAQMLRNNPNIVPALRLRIADLETRLVDLTSNNRDIMEHLRAIATEKP
jgi:uncharacterized protein DUF6090